MTPHYKNTADYIERKLLGKPEGYAVWLKFDDCRYILTLLEKAHRDGDSRSTDLYHRFKSQYKKPPRIPVDGL